MFKKNFDVESIYNDVNKMPHDATYLARLLQYIWMKTDEYLEPTVEESCIVNQPPPSGTEIKTTRYDSSKLEYLMWMNSLVSMAWLLTNVKEKTEHGHCHNPIHNDTQKQTGYTHFAIGSACHAKFYENIVSSLDQLFKYATEHRPKVIEKEDDGKKGDTTKGI
jgi:hypothetical protein